MLVGRKDGAYPVFYSTFSETLRLGRHFDNKISNIRKIHSEQKQELHCTINLSKKNCQRTSREGIILNELIGKADNSKHAGLFTTNK